MFKILVIILLIRHLISIPINKRLISKINFQDTTIIAINSKLILKFFRKSSQNNGLFPNCKNSTKGTTTFTVKIDRYDNPNAIVMDYRNIFNSDSVINDEVKLKKKRRSIP